MVYSWCSHGVVRTYGVVVGVDFFIRGRFPYMREYNFSSGGVHHVTSN